MKKDVVHGDKLGGTIEGFYQDLVIGKPIKRGTSV